MSKCSFCGADFSNAQAVRAHLKSCASYLENSSKPSQRNQLPKAAYEGSVSAGVAREIKDRVEAEKARLELRKIQREHSSMDAAEEDRKRRDEEKNAKNAQSLSDQEMEERIKAEEQELIDLRRGTIQDIKSRVIRAGIQVPEEFWAAALRRIEHVLADLDVIGIPDEELILIASAARDKAYRPYFQAQEEKKESATQKIKAMTLCHYGLEYARNKVNDDFTHWTDSEEMAERARLICLVDDELQEKLESRLTGTETQREVRDLVEAWIDEQ